jgi:fructokinase
MPQKIYTIGETVLDLLFKDDQPVASKAGGAMLNTSVSLGRLGLPVHFISEYATDQVGNMIDRFLQDNNVRTNYVYRFTDGKTALAMAFLDQNNNARYDFYKFYPQNRLDIVFPEVNPGDLILFGSFYGIAFEIRDKLKAFLEVARTKGALIYYDPNFRKSHQHELEKLKPAIIENMAMADIVRCSDEDLEIIAGVSTPDDAYAFVKQFCPNLIYTRSTKGVHVFTPSINTGLPVKKITPVSTIGAGDTFNAGVAYGIFNNGLKPGDICNLPEITWRELINYGVNFASEVCMSYDNYISKEYAAFLIKGT